MSLRRPFCGKEAHGKGCDGANGKEGDGRTDLNPEKKEKSAPVG